MKLINRFVAVAALALMPVVTACVPKQIPISTVSTVEAKTVYGLEATYNETAKAYLKLVDEGILTGAKKATAKKYLLESYGYLEKIQKGEDLVAKFKGSINIVKGLLT